MNLPPPGPDRVLIASYGPDRILSAELCKGDCDQWTVGNLLNVADMVRTLLRQVGLDSGAARTAKACQGEYCIEVIAHEGGFLAYRIPNDGP